MTVRAKLTLTDIHAPYGDGGTKVLKFNAVYDPDTPEDRRFQLATPTGSAELHIDNPAAIARFELGKAYYVDFTPADAHAAAVGTGAQPETDAAA